VGATLQGYVARELVAGFILTMLVLTVLLFLGMSLRWWESHRVPILTLAVALPYIFPVALKEALPVAILMATTLSYGRLARDNEVLAVKSSGASLTLLALPAVALGVVLSLVALWLNHSVIPAAQYGRASMFNKSPRLVLQLLAGSGEFSFKQRSEGGEASHRSKHVILKVDRVDKSVLAGISIQTYVDADGDGKCTECLEATNARTGRCTVTDSAIHMMLEDVEYNKYDPLTGERIHYYIMEQTDYTVESEKLLEARPPRSDEMTTDELWTRLDVIKDPNWQPDPASATQGKSPVPRYIVKPSAMYAIFSRSAQALACLAFVLVGVPLGLVSRTGHILSAFAMSILPVFVVYYPMILLGKALGETGRMNVFAAAWGGTLVLIAIGLVLTLYVMER